MKSPEGSVLGELTSQEPESQNKGSTDREASEGGRIGTPDSPHLLRSNSPPHDGRGEEGIHTGTVETEGCFRGTDAGEVDLILKDTDADKGRDEGGDHLRAEGHTRRDLEVMRELEVVAEVQRVGASDVSVRLEVAHGDRVAFYPSTANELGEHVQGDFHAGHGVDDADGNDEDEGNGNAEEDSSNSRVGRPNGEGDAA